MKDATNGRYRQFDIASPSWFIAYRTIVRSCPEGRGLNTLAYNSDPVALALLYNSRKSAYWIPDILDRILMKRAVILDLRQELLSKELGSSSCLHTENIARFCREIKR